MQLVEVANMILPAILAFWEVRADFEPESNFQFFQFSDFLTGSSEPHQQPCL